MRNISEYEKKIVKRFCALEKENKEKNNALRNYTFDYLINEICNKYNSHIILKKDSENGKEIVFNTKNTAGIDLANQRCEKELIDMLFFLKYLQENRWIYTSKNKPKYDKFIEEKIFGVKSDYLITRSIIDENLYQILSDSKYLQIYPTQSLIEFYNSGYKTIDNLRHIENIAIAENSLKKANWAIIISIILAIISLTTSAFI